MILLPRPLRDALPRIDAAGARMQDLLIGTLNRRKTERLRTRARSATERDRRAAGAWIRFETRGRAVFVAPLLVEGELAPMTAGDAPDAVGAAATLARIEPLVSTLERALGAELHPAGLAAHAPDGSVFVRLEGRQQGVDAPSRLVVALPPDLEIAPLASGTIETVALPPLSIACRICCDGPALPPARVARLGRGDLLLLGPAPLVGRIALPGRDKLAIGRIDLAGRAYVVDDQTTDRIEAERAPAHPEGAGPGLSGVNIPTVIELPGGSVTTDTLATLAPGSILPLPSSGGTLEVRVLAGGTPVAQGELVAIGDGFGVLLTATFDTAED